MRITLIFMLLAVFSQLAVAQTKIDEYEKLNPDDESGRLDNLANQLSRNPKSKGYILIYKEKSMPAGKFLRYFYGVQNYLKLIGLSPESIVMIPGEERGRGLTELWLVKEGEKGVDSKSIGLKALLNRKITNRTLFDNDCTGCSPPVFIDQFIFREGIDYLAAALKANPNSTGQLKLTKIHDTKERNELIREIIDRFKQNNIQRSRFSIRFTSDTLSDFYIVPQKIK